MSPIFTQPLPDADASAPLTDLGVVVIGRNEGQRLQPCLQSVLSLAAHTVYVDSGSTDRSVALAHQMGAHVVELDRDTPFTAARARNVGWKTLLTLAPSLQFIQFVDGDCEVIDNWLAIALDRLTNNPRLAAVCGRRHERYPDRSVYNRLADMEWNTPVGFTHACGGDAMFRLDALRQVNGYNDQLICGEEPQLCLRLRQSGWLIERIDASMTLHDAAMTRFAQWYKRSVRGGWAYAQGAAMHGRSPERYCVRQSRSIWFWALALPLLILIGTFFTPWTLLLLLGYFVMGYRAYLYRRTRHDPPIHAATYAFFCVLGKWPEMIGQLRYWLTRLRRTQPTLIEYKGAAPRADKSEISAT
jgi:glycosyltransferase involved in cell wall biosynthesis